MKTMTKFVAEDGAEFRTEKECADYESLCAHVVEIMADMGERPDKGCEFSNGRLGYIQHDPKVVDRVANRILDLARPFCSNVEHWLKWGGETHPSWPARAIDECCPRPIQRAWSRIYCIDNQGREFGQPFYRDNPDKCSSACLVDRRRQL